MNQSVTSVVEGNNSPMSVHTSTDIVSIDLVSQFNVFSFWSAMPQKSRTLQNVRIGWAKRKRYGGKSNCYVRAIESGNGAVGHDEGQFMENAILREWHFHGW